MRRWIGSMLAAFLVAVPLVALYKSTGEKGKDRATQFKNIRADYEKAAPKLKEAYEAAETNKERRAVLEKLDGEFAPRIFKLVEAEPKDELSFNALSWAVQALPNMDGKVFELLADNWAKDAQIKNLCVLFMQRPTNERAAKLLRKILDENKDKDAQGFACYLLAKRAAEKSKEGDKKAEEEAEKLYERVVKDFADVKVFGRGTLGDQAKVPLFEIRHLAIGKKAPNVESKDLEGKKAQLKDYKGKVVVLDIWATWCPPCRAMIPHERAMVKKLKDKPFALISISADEEKKTLQDFLKENEMPWTHWWNGPNSGILKDWNVQFFPTIYVLDDEGVIRYKNVRGQELEDAVEKLLAETKDKK